MINYKKIICALDFDDLSKAKNFIKAIDYDIVYKVGMEFFYRFGIDGITFPSKMDTELGKIDIYKSTSKQGVQQQKKMDNSEEFLRKS